MSIKKQLQEFYAKQGLEGKHLRKAIQWDMKAARRNDFDPACSGSRGYASSLGASFSWARSPEGSRYWGPRNGW